MEDNNNQSSSLIFQEYKLYTEQKDRFTERTFLINRFYMVLLLAMIAVIFLLKDIFIADTFSILVIFALAGMVISILWWINIDTYNVLIKTKLSKVIEEIEKMLPVQPFKMEYSAVQEYKKDKNEFIYELCNELLLDKNEFMFTDVQKVFASFIFLVYLIMFIVGILQMIIR